MKVYLQIEETEQLENTAACLRDKLLIRLLARLGCRISEALTIGVKDIDFAQGTVTIGHLVTIRGKIIFTSRSSVEVQIEVEAEDLLAGKKLHALTAYFIMVALDAKGKPTEVPPLILNTEEEEKLSNEALVRYKTRKVTSEKLKKEK